MRTEYIVVNVFAVCALFCAGCTSGKSSVQFQTAPVATGQQQQEKVAVKKADYQYYTTQKNDSLWKLAKKFYGDGNQWGRIFEANMGVIKSPDLLEPGTKIIIPE